MYLHLFRNNGTLAMLAYETIIASIQIIITLQWLHNELDGISNHRRLNGLLNRFFRRSSKKTSKLHVICLCEENSPGTDEFPSQRASNA